MSRNSNIHYPNSEASESTNFDPLAPTVISNFLKKKAKGKETPRKTSSNNDQSSSSQPTNNNQVINDTTKELESLEKLTNLYESLVELENEKRKLIEKQEFFGRDKTDEEKEVENEALTLIDQLQLDINSGVKIDRKRRFEEAYKKSDEVQEIERETIGRLKLMEQYVQQEDELRKSIYSREENELIDINQEKLVDLERINSNKFDLEKTVKVLEKFLKTNHGLKVIPHDERNILDDIKRYIVTNTKGLTRGYYQPIQNEVHFQEFNTGLSAKEIAVIKIAIIEEANASNIRRKKPIKNDDETVSNKLNYVINELNTNHPHYIRRTRFHEAFHAVTYLCSDKKDILGNAIPCSNSSLLMNDATKKIIYDLCEMKSPTYLNILDEQFQSEIITHLLERFVDVTNGKLKPNLKKGDYINFEGLKTDDLTNSKKALEIIQDSFSSTKEVCVRKLPENLNPVFSMQFLIINDAKEKIKELQEIKNLQDKVELAVNKDDVATGSNQSLRTQELQQLVEPWIKRIEKMRSEKRENEGRE